MSDHGHSNVCESFFFRERFSFESLERKFFTGLGSVRIVKNCDLGLENAAFSLRPRAAFSRPYVFFWVGVMWGKIAKRNGVEYRFLSVLAKEVIKDVF